MVLPALDLIVHNLLALAFAMVVVLLLSQILVTAFVRVSGQVLRVSAFRHLTAQDREALRKSLRRRVLLGVALFGAALVAGVVIASVRGIRALDLATSALAYVREQDFTLLKRHLWVAMGLAIGGGFTDVAARALASAAGKGLSRRSSST